MEQHLETRDVGRNRVNWRGAGAGSFKFGGADAVHGLKQRVSAQRGSLVVWNQVRAAPRTANQ